MRGLSEYSWDYFFPRDEKGQKITILGGRERRTGMCMATAVPEKGSKGRFVVDKVKEMMEEVGDRGQTVTIKSDQEDSIVVLKKAVAAAREGKSPVRPPRSNGSMERAIRAWHGQLRTLKHHMESRIKCRILADSALFGWLVPFAADVINKLKFVVIE